MRAQAPRQFQAVKAGHLDVEHHGERLPLRRHFANRVRIFERTAFEPVRVQQHLQRVRRLSIVVHDEYAPVRRHCVLDWPPHDHVFAVVEVVVELVVELVVEHHYVLPGACARRITAPAARLQDSLPRCTASLMTCFLNEPRSRSGDVCRRCVLIASLPMRLTDSLRRCCLCAAATVRPRDRR